MMSVYNILINKISSNIRVCYGLQCAVQIPAGQGGPNWVSKVFIPNRLLFYWADFPRGNLDNPDAIAVTPYCYLICV